ncbi:TIGR01457 family HAD-type hydrolase [Barrientosiimonas marina]|uniref:Acid sugar phosphatase n=1 Tax=Lentibacillus kimchii TaxID=1542911 RepID=A0ABW2UQR6_9BACI
MTTYNAYIIDLDGTMYRGNEPIAYAAAFVDTLVSEQIPYLFLTNNSSKTPAQVSHKLQQMGIPSTAEHVLTSSMATADYIKREHPQARCYVIGEEGLHEALKQEGLAVVEENSDFVIIGMDHSITYDSLSKACREVRHGAQLISTNADTTIPTDRGMEPGNGALTSVVSVSTGKQPTFIGKPETIIIDQALKRLDAEKPNTLMVGDNYDTDIGAGINAGIDTLMVFTGVTPFSCYPSLPVKPSYYVQNLSEWLPHIKKTAL